MSPMSEFGLSRNFVLPIKFAFVVAGRSSAGGTLRLRAAFVDVICGVY